MDAIKPCPIHGAELMEQTKPSRLHPEWPRQVYCEACKAKAIAMGMETKRRNGTRDNFRLEFGPRVLGVQD